MPYVNTEARQRIMDGGRPYTPGELNFCITNYLANECATVEYDKAKAHVRLMVNRYIEDVHQDRLTYAAINDVVGVMCCAAYEAVRRDAAEWIWDLLFDLADNWYIDNGGPYEDLAIARNGDVYPG